jgi:hypothetical protein
MARGESGVNRASSRRLHMLSPSLGTRQRPQARRGARAI